MLPSEIVVISTVTNPQEHSVPDTRAPMPVESLVEELLYSSLYWLSADGRELVGALVRCEGRVRSMQMLVAALGLRNRHQLTRLLAREQLPSLECLAGWIRVLLWVTAWERHHTPLAYASLVEGHDPAVRFRTIRRVADCTWNELKQRGSVWAAQELRSRCTTRAKSRVRISRSA